jgi:hypothetical protein
MSKLMLNTCAHTPHTWAMFKPRLTWFDSAESTPGMAFVQILASVFVLQAVPTSKDRQAMPSTWMVAYALSMLVVIVLTICAASIVQGGNAYVLRFPASVGSCSALHGLQGLALHGMAHLIPQHTDNQASATQACYGNSPHVLPIQTSKKTG